jgi:Raf kinase inhibitor-like YbhB/YbcL family protein
MILGGVLVLLNAACQPVSELDLGGTVMTFKLISPAFAEGANIPTDFSCEGQDTSPELRWSDAPANTRSLALIMDDPDAPGGTFTHWVLFDIPAVTTQLAAADQSVGVGGQASFGRSGYGGPCPPKGRGAHRYFFKLYALDVASLRLKAGASRSEVEAAIKGHVIGQAQLMGRFER